MEKVTITEVRARMVLDSRGTPTVEADVTLASGHTGRAAVPSGASTGSHEAVELRDGDDSHYFGKGVQKAIGNINGEISDALDGQDATDQAAIDQIMIDLDGTANKARLGANATLAVSLAVAKARAAMHEQSLFAHLLYMQSVQGAQETSCLPMPMVNVLNGGRHATGAADIQECMIVPVSATSMSQAIEMSATVFAALKKLLAKKGLPTTVGDEGGFAPPVPSNQASLDLLMEAIDAAGYEAGKEIALALDVAATELYHGDGKYHLPVEDKKLSSMEMIELLARWQDKYPIVSIEDGLAEDDWEGWAQLTEKLGSRTQLVGDDLLVTNVTLLEKGIKQKAANAILIKPNQIGTLTETIAAVNMAKQAGWGTVISHRSGETEDTSIAHIAVGLDAGQIKTGSMSRGERTAKYNELLRIEEALGSRAKMGCIVIGSK